MKRVYIREITALFDGGLSFNPIVDCKNPILLKTVEEILKKVGIRDDVENKIYVNINLSGTRVSIKYKEHVYSDKELKRVVFFYLKTEKYKKLCESDVYKNLWKSDSVFLLFLLLNIINISGQNIDKIISDLPDFYITSKYVKKSLKKGETAKRLYEINDGFYKKHSYNLTLKNGRVKIMDLPNSDQIKILCASDNYSCAKELCEFFEEYLGGMNT